MQAGETRHGGHFLVDLRVVFHSAAAERIESGIDAEVHLGEIGVVAYHVHFAHLRQIRSIAALEFCRQFLDADAIFVFRKGITASSRL